MTFELFLRPGEAFKIRAIDLVPPVAHVYFRAIEFAN